MSWKSQLSLLLLLVSLLLLSMYACAWDVLSRCFCFILAGQLTFTSWRVDHQEASPCQAHLLSGQTSQCSCEPSKWDDTVLPGVCPHTAPPQWGVCVWLHYWLNIAAGQTLCCIPSLAKALRQQTSAAADRFDKLTAANTLPYAAISTASCMTCTNSHMQIHHPVSGIEL